MEQTGETSSEGTEIYDLIRKACETTNIKELNNLIRKNPKLYLNQQFPNISLPINIAINHYITKRSIESIEIIQALLKTGAKICWFDKHEKTSSLNKALNIDEDFNLFNILINHQIKCGNWNPLNLSEKSYFHPVAEAIICNKIYDVNKSLNKIGLKVTQNSIKTAIIKLFENFINNVVSKKFVNTSEYINILSNEINSIIVKIYDIYINYIGGEDINKKNIISAISYDFLRDYYLSICISNNNHNIIYLKKYLLELISFNIQNFQNSNSLKIFEINEEAPVEILEVKDEEELSEISEIQVKGKESKTKVKDNLGSIHDAVAENNLNLIRYLT